MMNLSTYQLGCTYMSVGESTMQTETDVGRMPEGVVGRIDQLSSLSALSLSFEPDDVHTGEPAWKPDVNELIDLSSTLCDPYMRGGQQAPPYSPYSASAPTQGTPVFYGGTSQGNSTYQAFGAQTCQPLTCVSAGTPPTCCVASPRHDMERPLQTVVASGYSCNGWPQVDFPPERQAYGQPRVQTVNNRRPLGNRERDLPHGVRLPQRRGATQLWEFLLDMLNKEGNESVISWSNKDIHEFCVLDPDELGRRWGELKGRPRMNYDKLSRSLRYYYQKKLIIKVPTEKHVYRFLCPPEILADALGRRDKKMNKPFVAEGDTSCETTPSPATTNSAQNELDNDGYTGQLQSPAKEGVTELLRKHLQSQPSKNVAPLWHPPSPLSPTRSRDANKKSRRTRPYTTQRTSCPNIFPNMATCSLGNMKGQPYNPFQSSSGPNMSVYSSGTSFSLPSEISLGDFSPEILQEHWDSNPGSPFSSTTDSPNSPHSFTSDLGNDSDDSETTADLIKFVESCMQDSYLLTLFGNESDQLPSFSDGLYPALPAVGN